jgi:hypothetical protein
MVLNSGEPQKYAYSTENDDAVILNQNPNSDELKIVNVQTKDEFKTSVRSHGTEKKQLIVDDLPKEAGHYLIKDGDETIQSISYNFPRKESVPEFYTEDELRKQIDSKEFTQFQVIESTNASFSEKVQNLNNGKQLWKYFIVLAIFFLACEMAIIRFWKN